MSRDGISGGPTGPLLRVPTCSNHPATVERWSHALQRYVSVPVCGIDFGHVDLSSFDLADE